MNKYDHVRSAGQTRAHGCHWPGCPRQVPPALWGCREHWYRIPKPLRDRIWATYAAGQEIAGTPSAEYLEAADAVQRWIRSQSMPPVDAPFALSAAGEPSPFLPRIAGTQRANLAAGRHPLGLPWGPEDSTCGACVHHFVFTRSKRYHKCELRATRCAATDIRVSWRGCSEFARLAPDAEPKTIHAPD